MKDELCIMNIEKRRRLSRINFLRFLDGKDKSFNSGVVTGPTYYVSIEKRAQNSYNYKKIIEPKKHQKFMKQINFIKK